MNADVLVVGAGPVGQLLAILLGQRGHRVLVLERWPRPYPLPRAVVFDDEIARVLATAGVLDRVPGEVPDTYEWRNGTGDVLLRFDWSGVGPAGHPVSTMFSQPELEAVLAGRMAELPTVTVLRGCEVVDLVTGPGSVEIHTADGGRHDARWVVGADGAESFVRRRMGVAVQDLGFAHDWLIVDVQLHEQRPFEPMNLQICDPVRPTTLVSGGPGRRRWEFMRLPGETAAELNTTDTAWRLLAPFDVHPGNAELERHAVYTFRARWVQEWRAGRLLLAGDAAHLMPPFAGQGMCSGLRDAANLAWKLDLVLSGRCGDALLDTYGTERGAHVQHAVHLSVELGKVICVLDAAHAAGRDAALLAVGPDPARALPPAPPPVLGPGVLGPGPDVGRPVAQARVRSGGVTGLFDDVVGRGFVVATAGDPRAALRPEQLDALDALGAHLVQVGGGAVEDLDATIRDEWAAAGCAGEIVRPDAYRFARVPSPAALPGLVDDLLDRLHLRREVVA